MRQKRIIEGKRLTILFMGVVAIIACFALSFSIAREIRERVVRQFNEEQLVIARSVSSKIEREINSLKKEMVLLAEKMSSPENTLFEGDIIHDSLFRMTENGVWRIEVADLSVRKARIYMRSGQSYETQDISDELYQIVENRKNREGHIWIFSQLHGKEVMTILFIREIKGDPLKFIIMRINLHWFFDPVLRDAHFGKTGYAWIIDQEGRFLYHPKTSFIGRDAFKIREEDYPDVPVSLIHSIQKERMLKGLEGTGQYFSGWHRGITGGIKKLIAYTPIRIDKMNSQIWSIALVAPVSEIKDILDKGHLKLFFIQIFLFLTVVAGMWVLILFEKRWSRKLEDQANERTEELKRSDEKYRSLVESTEDFIFSVDSAGNFLSMNSFTANYFGGRPEDFVGKGLNFIFPHKAVREQVKLIQSVYKYGKSVRDEFELQVGDYRIWISANFLPLKDKEGMVNSVLCIARDITENKNLERQLISTEKLASMGTLAAGVAHEINNPLGVILGFCDLLLRKAKEGTQEYEDLKTIERQGLHCKQVVENLLSFSRIEEGNLESSDLYQNLCEVIAVVRHNLEMNNIELITDFSRDIPPVNGEPRQLQQVFLNLINNAVAAMKGGGRLKICALLERDKKHAVVKISDNGVGINKEDLDRIYEPFFTTKAEGEGTGLGLFVSYGIVKKYGGSINCVTHTAASTDGESGTTFCVKMPVLKKGEINARYSAG
ncbi:MAG: PAS domain S-box protein [Deltaproteobacteria bacterium]|nr:PAS domain S-box protein [Deltaproteobacteria bacterium]